MHCLRTMEKTLANLLRSSIFLLLLQIDVSFAQSFSGNIALNKSATQSNTYGSRVARYAVDGDRDTSNVDKCATAANANGQYNWWQVDLGDIYVVTSITLYISTSSQDGTYLQNSDVFVGNNNVDVTNQPKCWSFGVTTGISLGGSRTFNCSNLVVGRHITVRKNVMYDALTICEFMATGNVIGSPFSGNVAYLQPTSQLKTFGGDRSGRFARYAVDGSFDTTNLAQCACSDDVANYNWWQVDLTTVYVVTAVTIYAPTASSGQNEYLNVKNSNIYVGSDNSLANVDNQPICVSFGADGVTPGGRQTFNCSQWLVGRYVTIKKTTQGQMLTICEVELSAYIIDGVTMTLSTTTTSTITSTSTTTTTSTSVPSTTTTTTTTSTTTTRPSSTSTTSRSSSVPSTTTTTSTTTARPSSMSTTIPRNVANQMSAKQLKTFGGDEFGRLAKYAVDGNNDTTNLDRCACSDDSSYNWLQVDLTNVSVVTAVTIYAPTASFGQSEYYNVRYCNITVGNDSSEANVSSQPVCASIGPDGVNPGGHQTFNCNPRLIGRYVTIRKTTPGQMLTICEVEINIFIESTSPTSTLKTTSSTTAMFSVSTDNSTALNSPIKTSDGLSEGAKAGIVVGVILGVVVLFLLLFLVIFLYINQRCLFGKSWDTTWIRKRFSIKAPDITRLDSDVPLTATLNNNGTKNIPIDQLEVYIKQKKAKADAFKTEFKMLPEDLTEKVTVGSLPEHKAKNRFKNVLPFDCTLVPIKVPDDDGSISNGYINANFIRGYKNVEKAYIATQGPKTQTVNDFWLMIDQHNVNRIVMVTRLVENGKPKCEKYWPDRVHETRTFGSISVTMSVEDEFADFIYRQFAMVNLDTQGSRIITHYHYISFDDKTRPSQIFPLLSFRNRLKMQDDSRTGPLVVHCSAGIGRTGTFIALDYLLQQAQQEHEVNIFDCVKSLRHQRMNLVQTQGQYEFLHEAVLDGITTGNTSIPCASYISIVTALSTADKENMSKIAQQFKHLEKMKAAPTDRTTSYTSGIDATKNRSAHIVAYDDSMPSLSTPSTLKEGNEYINAVFVNSFRSKDAYVMTQMPLPWTVLDFWRMIYDYKMPLVVLLAGNDTIDEDCPAYWPTGSTTMDLGPLQIELVSSNDCNLGSACVTVRDLVVTRTGTLDSVELRQYQLQNWPTGEDVPDSSSIIVDVINAVMHYKQQTASDGPIVMQCYDGAARCGLFAVSCYLIEKIKTDQEVDVFLSCRYITSQRPKAIDTFDQYKFLYDVAAACMTQYEEYANFSRSCINTSKI